MSYSKYASKLTVTAYTHKLAEMEKEAFLGSLVKKLIDVGIVVAKPAAKAILYVVAGSLSLGWGLIWGLLKELGKGTLKLMGETLIAAAGGERNEEKEERVKRNLKDPEMIARYEEALAAA